MLWENCCCRSKLNFLSIHCRNLMVMRFVNKKRRLSGKYQKLSNLRWAFVGKLNNYCEEPTIPAKMIWHRTLREEARDTWSPPLFILAYRRYYTCTSGAYRFLGTYVEAFYLHRILNLWLIWNRLGKNNNNNNSMWLLIIDLIWNYP